MSEDTLDIELGQKIRTVRRMRGLSLKKVSEDIGMSYSYLSKLENGKHSASIVVLQRLANYFEIDLVYFFDSNRRESEVIRKDDMPDFETEDGLSFGVLTSQDSQDMQVTLVHLPKNSPSEQNIHQHDTGKEFITVVTGELYVVVDGEENVLDEGDSILFDSQAEHIMFTKNKEAKFIMVVSPPYGRNSPLG